MKVYETDKIRNVVLVGHQGAGKTSLSEAMLFCSGAINRLGSVGDHTTVSDYHDSEHQREMSIFASLLHVEHQGHKINILDAPGYPDFNGEVVASMRVADAAVFVLNATDPVQVGTELGWRYAQEVGIPAIFVVNQCDKSGVDFPSVVEKIQERFGRTATPLQLPVGDGTRAICDLLSMKQLTFAEGKGAPEAADIAGGFKERVEELRNELVENVAENDESLLEAYAENGELTEDELMTGLRTAIRERQLFPILITSATHNIGVARVLDFIAAGCPSPLEAKAVATEDGGELRAAPDGPPIAFVYRVMSEPHVGEYAFLKVYSGAVETGMDLENADNGSGERVGSLFVLSGRNRDAVAKLCAGDIGVTVKLKNTRSNQTLRVKGNDTAITPIAFPPPRYTAAIRTTTAGEEDKMSTGLHTIVGEDPSLKIIHEPDLGQLLIGGQGEMHIEIAKFRLKNRFGVEVELSIPKVSYRETIQKSGKAQYRHKKQTGGAGQFADVSFIVEPLKGEYQPPPEIKVRDTTTYETSWGAKLELIEAIVGGVIDMRRFAGAIQKGIMEAMRKGPLAGYPCGDIRVIVYDGKMHAVDSNEAAFKTAARQCFRIGFEAASPVLLEPICDLEVLMPDDYTGDVMSDLNTRRARIQGMEAEGPNQKILAQAPEAELLRYSTQLRSLTQGRGLHNARFRQYEPMPRNVQDKIVEEAKKAAEED